MQQDGMLLTPRALLSCVVRTVQVMLGRLPMNSAFALTPQGLWQAVGASAIIAFIVSVYPMTGGGIGLLAAKVTAHIISIVAMSLLFMTVLRLMGLADKEFALLVPFIWIENIQYLAAGLVAYMMMLGGSEQVPVMIFGPLLVWTIYWLWRTGRDQLGRGGWVASGFLILSVLVDSVVTFTLLSRIHLAAG